MHILVHLDDSPACMQTLGVAARVAARQGALLRGMFVPGTVSAADRTRAVHEAFLKAAAAEELCTEWLGRADDPKVLIGQAFASDMLVTGQPVDKRGMELAETLILLSGRPVLAVPREGNFVNCGSRVMVAWSDGREAARALHDVLPLLKAAHHVWLLQATRELATDPSVLRRREDLVSYLNHHGVAALMDVLPWGDLHLGDLLQQKGADEAIDLIVMGAFATLPGGKLVLGHFAEYMLRTMTLPIVFSH